MGISTRILVEKQRPVAQIETKNMLLWAMCPNLICSCIITVKIVGDFGACGVAVFCHLSCELDNDRIKLDNILISSNQTIH